MAGDTELDSGGIPDPERTARLSPGIRRLDDGAVMSKYRIDRQLGAGSMGVVYLAFDRVLERHVALKVLPDEAASSDARERLVREARAMARLTHPNVVRVYEVGAADGRDFVAMELVEGSTLGEWLREAPRSPREIIAAFVAAGRGLGAAHAAGIIHRDFKPTNVLRRGRDGQIVVADFGVARERLDVAPLPPPATRDTPNPLADLTQAGSAIGTPAYMPPEQWFGEEIDPRADQFAFCVSLWEALAGERPYRGGTDEIRAAIVRGPSELDASKIPRRIRAAIVRGLDPDPDRRWPSIDALLRAIDRSRRGLFAGVGAVVAIAVGVLVWVLARDGAAWQPAVQRLEPIYAENANAPAISPDGKRLAFASDRLDPHGELTPFVMPIGGGPAERITSREPAVDSVTWTRDGKALLLVRDGRLIRHPLDGGEETTLATDIYTVEDCGDALVAVTRADELVAIEPDGKREVMLSNANIERPRCIDSRRIVYVRTPTMRIAIPADGALGDIWLVEDRRHHRRVTSDARSADPSFTPGGRSIVFVRQDADGLQLHEHVFAGGAEHQLTFGGGPDLGPAVSPDGKTLVFDRDTTTSEAQTGLVGGSSVRVPTPRHDFADLQPTKDGKRLVGMRVDGDGPHVVVIDVADGHQTDLGLGDDACRSGDDRRVYFHTLDAPTVLHEVPIEGGTPRPIATFPEPITRCIDAAGRLRVVLRGENDVLSTWTVDAGKPVLEVAGARSIPAPSGPWRAVTVARSEVELVAPGQPARNLTCNTGVGEWLDDHRFACATDGRRITTLDAATGEVEHAVITTRVADEIRIVVTPDGIRWASTTTTGEVTRFAITNFADRPWKP